MSQYWEFGYRLSFVEIIILEILTVVLLIHLWSTRYGSCVGFDLVIGVNQFLINFYIELFNSELCFIVWELLWWDVSLAIAGALFSCNTFIPGLLSLLCVHCIVFFNGYKFSSLEVFQLNKKLYLGNTSQSKLNIWHLASNCLLKYHAEFSKLKWILLSMIYTCVLLKQFWDC